VRRSLAFRIISLSGAWVTMTLLITALLLLYFYRDHTAQHYDEHVAMHLEELLGASRFLPDGTFDLTFNPSDPRYHNLNSGWYWEVQQSGVSLRRSPSLGESSLHLGDVQPSNSMAIYELPGPLHETLRVHIVKARPDPNYASLTYISSAPMTNISDDVLGYTNHIIASFLVLGIGLLLAVVLQVRVALKPLQAISSGITDVREGRAPRLPQAYPVDVQPLVDELNNLLEHNAVLLKRARNQLGDLAHAVKNPLTVIKNETRNMQPGQKDLMLQQTSEITKSVNHYLSRARTFGTENVLGARSDVKTVAEDLVFAMQRIYQQRKLEYDCSQVQESCFRGDGQDLEEMLGNLMDNASKWARKKVLVCCSVQEDRLILVVEDDGPGIPDGSMGSVMHRGNKLDESKPGHGQGLGIVNDIADLYGGSLTLSRSQLGGVRARLDLPAT